MRAGSPVVELSGVGVRFGRSPVLKSVDLVVEPGEVVGVIGANGSGKSTLLRVLATLLRPSVGTVRVFGVEAGADRTWATRRRLALLGHHPSVWGELTLMENLALVGRLAGVGDERVEAVLERVGLRGAMHRRADHSSHGMLRRVDFARTLLTRPELLLLDEAHAGLDRAARPLVDVAVSEVIGRNGGVVLVSHELEQMRPLVTTTYQLTNGTLDAIGSLR